MEKNQDLYEKLKAIRLTEADTLERDLEIRLLDPETRQAKSGRVVTYLNVEYRDPSKDDAQWKRRSMPIFTNEAKVILDGGPYEEGKLYHVKAEKNQDDFFEWKAVGEPGANLQRDEQMQYFAQQRQEQAVSQPVQAQAMSTSHEPQH